MPPDAPSGWQQWMATVDAPSDGNNYPFDLRPLWMRCHVLPRSTTSISLAALLLIYFCFVQLCVVVA